MLQYHHSSASSPLIAYTVGHLATSSACILTLNWLEAAIYCIMLEAPHLAKTAAPMTLSPDHLMQAHFSHPCFLSAHQKDWCTHLLPSPGTNPQSPASAILCSLWMTLCSNPVLACFVVQILVLHIMIVWYVLFLYWIIRIVVFISSSFGLQWVPFTKQVLNK